MKTTEQRFWEKVEIIPFHPCWEWAGGKQPEGYGVFNKTKAHRFSYELHKGPVPVGLFVMHSCDNRGCVNPDHLSVGTNRDNMVDCKNKGRIPRSFLNRTHCIKGGHLLGPETIHIKRDGARVCKICRRIKLTEASRRRRKTEKEARLLLSALPLAVF